MHAEEGADRGVDAGKLHRDEAELLLASARAAIALIAEPTDAELLEGGQELEGECVLGPVAVDDGLDLRLHVTAHLLQERELVRSQYIDELIEIAVGSRQLMRLSALMPRHCCR